ncbi:MAG: hypothetical protein ABFS56_33640 [Pseudomonadota bacterium]
MSDQVFSIDEDLTKEYRRYFKDQGVIGYYKSPYVVEPKKKIYHLCSEDGELTVLGDSLKSVHKRLQDIYYANQLELDFRVPAKKQETVKITPKRLGLLDEVSKIKTWGRGVIAKIAANLGRKVGAVRQMLSVLTKKGLLVRIQRGQYALSNEQLFVQS